MNNLKTIILLVIIFILGVSAVYYVYQKQVTRKSGELPQKQTFADINNPSPAPSGDTSSAINTPALQPNTGSNTLEIKNEGIKIEYPQAQSKISSPLTLQGSANVFEGKVIINVKDARDKILGTQEATACMDYDACPFLAIINFEAPKTLTGTLEVYNPSKIDNQKKYLQLIPIVF